jgi:glycosyltransferase involved in cell wall biosynthesis
MFQTLRVVVTNDASNPEYYGPEQALIGYLEKKGVASLLYINHLSYEVLISEARYYEANKLKNITKLSLPFVGNYWLTAIYRFISTFFFVLNIKRRFDIYIGTRGLNALVGLILKKMRRVETVVYLSHISNESSSFIIRALDSYCIHSVDLVWNLSRRLTKIMEEQGILRERNIWVPVGVHLEEIRNPIAPPTLNDVKRLVYLGILSPGKGVELIIEALPLVLQRVSNVELIIIGGGPLEDLLKKSVNRLGLGNNVNFLGYMEYHQLVEFLPKCHLGLAPYEPISDNTAWTTDPLKPKLYMSCGLPVIITDFPETVSEVRESEAGLVIRYDKDDLAEAMVMLLTDNELFKRCSENAIKVAHKYEWGKIFDNAFQKIFGCWQAEKESEKLSKTLTCKSLRLEKINGERLKSRRFRFEVNRANLVT